jgi:Protein of unknown function (DUF3667)
MSTEADSVSVRACPRCGAVGSARFCGECGVALHAATGDARTMLREDVIESLGFDRRLLRTLRDLLLHPVRITQAVMEGTGARYLPPLRLSVTLASLYVVLLFVARPAEYSFSGQLRRAATQGRTAGKYQKMLEKRAISPELADERYQSRTVATLPAVTVLSLLPLVPVLRLLNRRRSWHQHFLFLLAFSNIVFVYGLLAVPLFAISIKAFTALLSVALYPVFAVVFWKIYPGRSRTRTVLAFVTVGLVNLIAGMLFTGLGSVLVMLSLLFF